MNRDLGIDTPAIRNGGRNDAGDDEDDGNAFFEKRRHRRRQIAVRCWLADGKSTIYARVHDVSMGGLSIRAPVPFSPNTELDLALVLPASELGDPNGIVAVRARGRVVWVRSREGGPRMGAQFLGFETGQHALSAIVD